MLGYETTQKIHIVVYWTFSSHRIRTQPTHWPLFQLGSILDRNVADLVSNKSIGGNPMKNSI